jgi:hypothetical protein
LYCFEACYQSLDLAVVDLYSVFSSECPTEGGAGEVSGFLEFPDLGAGGVEAAFESLVIDG